jgi:hypothetical protein
MQPVILDTDVASLTHKRRLPQPLATRLTGRRPLITFVTLGELTKWAEIRHIKDYEDFRSHHGLRILGTD